MAAERRAAKEAYLKSIKDQKAQGGLVQKIPNQVGDAAGGLDFDGGRKDKENRKPVVVTSRDSSARDKKWELQRQKFLAKKGRREEGPTVV